MKKLFLVIIAAAIVLQGMAYAQVNVTINPSPGQAEERKPEKPLVIKGLSIGMDVQDARKIVIQLLEKEWKITPVAESAKIMEDFRFGESEIFGMPQSGLFVNSVIGDHGFAIINKSGSYEGFVSCNKEKGTVTQISFGGNITDHIFSTAGVDVHVFVEAFRNNFNMPAFPWIPRGWSYASPHGYVLRIMTNKVIDIKKIDFQQIGVPPAGIKFD